MIEVSVLKSEQYIFGLGVGMALKKNRIAFLYMFFNDEPFEAHHRQHTSFPDVTFTCQAH